MKRVGAWFAVIALLLAVAVPAAAAPRTKRQQEIDNRIGSLRSQLAELSQEEERLIVELDASEARIIDLNQQVGRLDQQLLGARREFDAAQARLDRTEQEYLTAVVRLDGARSRLRAARAEMQARALAAYTNGPALGRYAEVVLDVDDLTTLAARTGYMASLLEQQSVAVVRHERIRDEIAELRTSLEESRQLALDQRNVVALRKADLEDARRRQAAMRERAQAEQARRESLLGTARSQQAQFEAQIRALQAESESIAAALRARQAGQGVQSAGRGILARPVPGAVTSTFGPRLHPIFGDIRQHTGVDFRGGQGTPVRAAATGEVVSAGPRGGYGNAVVIDHGGSLATLSAHLSRVLVAAGEPVAKGQVVGYVGATGFATGPHLHFEVRIGGTPVNPLSYL